MKAGTVNALFLKAHGQYREFYIYPVKRGYLKNYLIKQQIACYANKSNIEYVEKNKKKLFGEKQPQSQSKSLLKSMNNHVVKIVVGRNEVKKISIVRVKKALSKDFPDFISSDFVTDLQHIHKVGNYQIKMKHIKTSTVITINVNVVKSSE